MQAARDGVRSVLLFLVKAQSVHAAVRRLAYRGDGVLARVSTRWIASLQKPRQYHRRAGVRAAFGFVRLCARKMDSPRKSSILISAAPIKKISCCSAKDQTYFSRRSQKPSARTFFFRVLRQLHFGCQRLRFLQTMRQPGSSASRPSGTAA